jgi:uncharacterized RDD family membrane protein YckC
MPSAKDVVRDAGQGPGINPYAPPAASPPSLRETPLKPSKTLASLGRRFGGHLIDQALALIAGILLSHVCARITGQARTLPMVTACTLAASTVNWALVVSRGQTVGKILVRTRIALLDGANPGFFHGVVLRVWPWTLIQVLPVLVGPVLQLRALVSIAFFVDALWIFAGGTRRCVHDHLAGTWVVDARR